MPTSRALPVGQTASAEVSLAESSGALRSSILGLLRILLIEDEPANSAHHQPGLAGHGYDVTAVGTGEEGVGLASSENFDLVLLDISLPDLDGHGVLKQIRAVDQRLPVLMLTARDDLPNKLEALEGGAGDGDGSPDSSVLTSDSPSPTSPASPAATVPVVVETQAPPPVSADSPDSPASA
ncbi:MAG: response regulator [Dehalococcoidia bacterium]|nr:response regulator [Dehalococcoidia bacterium]